MHFHHFLSLIHLFSRHHSKRCRDISILFGAAIVAASLTGCSRQETTGKVAAQPEQSKTFDLRGEIVGVLGEKRLLMVHHEEIPNYMPAMTMEFKIGDAEITSFREGQKITAKMIDEKNGDFLLESIRVVDPAKDFAVTAAARALQQETLVRGKAAYREIGEVVPGFSLYDQTGEVFNMDHLRGQRVILNFIFTRCPIATMCPAATSRVIALQRAAKEQNVPDLHLVSISLDPSYDTPPVLKAYASARGVDSSNFSFLTGPESAVRNLPTQFGVAALASNRPCERLICVPNSFRSV